MHCDRRIASHGLSCDTKCRKHILPMHIPVLICGLFCGAPYGLACGMITPFLSSMTTGMPPAMILPQ